MGLTVELYDKLICLVAKHDVPEPLPVVLIWGDEAYLKMDKDRYYNVPMHVIEDTRTSNEILDT